MDRDKGLDRLGYGIRYVGVSLGGNAGGKVLCLDRFKVNAVY